MIKVNETTNILFLFSGISQQILIQENEQTICSFDFELKEDEVVLTNIIHKGDHELANKNMEIIADNWSEIEKYINVFFYDVKNIQVQFRYNVKLTLPDNFKIPDVKDVIRAHVKIDVPFTKKWPCIRVEIDNVNHYDREVIFNCDIKKVY